METKNGAVIRKHIGYGYMDASHAERLNAFYRDFMNPYWNYHRPGAQPQVSIDDKGRKRITYQHYQTPLETLLALPQAAKYFRPGLPINARQRVGAARRDTEAAQLMQQAKAKLFAQMRLSA